jgi:hypothetical protein
MLLVFRKYIVRMSGSTLPILTEFCFLQSYMMKLWQKMQTSNHYFLSSHFQITVHNPSSHLMQHLQLIQWHNNKQTKNVCMTMFNQLSRYDIWTCHVPFLSQWVWCVHKSQLPFKPGAPYTVWLVASHTVLISSKCCKEVLSEWRLSWVWLLAIQNYDKA